VNDRHGKKLGKTAKRGKNKKRNLGKINRETRGGKSRELAEGKAPFSKTGNTAGDQTQQAALGTDRMVESPA